MGAKITEEPEGLRIHPGQLTGCRLDMNETPDALPMMAVVGCFAKGETELVNVPQARYKETDRIAVMREELSRMGAKITELDDGLVIEESPLRPAKVHGHHDHRVVMALAVAATGVQGETEISTAEAMEVTFPDFVEKMSNMGADFQIKSD
jgi:3-phosphoshikimate 1-carboxyvinyltransferase